MNGNITSIRPRVYLAGPSVFRPDAVEIGERLKATCAKHGLIGLYPVDGAATKPTARQIFEGNIALIRSAAAVIADISPFRGPHADDGTAFEIGFAHALGLPVFAYTSDPNPLAWRIPARAVDGVLRDDLGDEVEDFAAPANLMLACPVESVSTSADDAIEAAATYLRLARPT